MSAALWRQPDSTAEKPQLIFFAKIPFDLHSEVSAKLPEYPLNAVARAHIPRLAGVGTQGRPDSPKTMKHITLSALVALSTLSLQAVAHTLVWGAWVNGVDQGDGRNLYVRSPPNNNPVKDLTSDAMTCNVDNRGMLEFSFHEIVLIVSLACSGTKYRAGQDGRRVHY